MNKIHPFHYFYPMEEKQTFNIDQRHEEENLNIMLMIRNAKGTLGLKKSNLLGMLFHTALPYFSLKKTKTKKNPNKPQMVKEEEQDRIFPNNN